MKLQKMKMYENVSTYFELSQVYLAEFLVYIKNALWYIILLAELETLCR